MTKVFGVLIRALRERQLPDDVKLAVAGAWVAGRLRVHRAIGMPRLRAGYLRWLARLRNGPLPDFRLELDGSGWTACAEPTTGSLAQAGDAVSAEVTAVLGNRGIDYWLLDDDRRGLSTIGLLESDRRRAHLALRTAPDCRLMYLTPTSGRRRLLGCQGAGSSTPGGKSWRITQNIRLGAGHIEGQYVGSTIDFHDSPPALAPADAPVRCDFPIDVVYTWVDGSDPAWAAEFQALWSQHYVATSPLAANSSRFTSRDELRYSLRSLARYADHVNHIWIVTASQRPEWLSESPKLTVVDHAEILPEDCLPTFNSHAIESRLHHISDLTEHFLYLNDDVFFAHLSAPEQFFLPDGTPKFFVAEAAIPPGVATAGDAPVDAAAKNGRDLLRREFGRAPTHKLRHTPHALKRSLLFEMEDRFNEEFVGTTESRFRSPQDFSIASFLAPYFAYFTGRGHRGELEDRYVNMHTRWASPRLQAIRQSSTIETFCINETDVDPSRADRAESLVARFLRFYFPIASPWER